MVFIAKSDDLTRKSSFITVDLFVEVAWSPEGV
jgi:hypothetical protein